MTAKSTSAAEDATASRPRLIKLIIKNFRCIGSTPVTIELDDIVVLVGPNNVGKSSVLKAYEVIMSEGSTAGQRTIDDFPSGKIDSNALPEIELHTIVYDNSPGPKWIAKTDSGEMLVKERWRWLAPGAPVRRGFNAQKNRWATEEDGFYPVVADTSKKPDNGRKECVCLSEVSSSLSSSRALWNKRTSRG